MLVRTTKTYNRVKSSEVTPESVYLNRRSLLAGGLGMAGIGLAGLPIGLKAASLNPAFSDAGFPLTPEELATTYNNYYEFGTNKFISQAAQALSIEPWSLQVDGLTNRPGTHDAWEIIRRAPLEDRIYRLRCVEAWSMVLPYTGFPLAWLVKEFDPKPEARFVRFETFLDPEVARTQRTSYYPWPYVEGFTIGEAMNELAFVATGLYGKDLPKQNGAPWRIAMPWKYGFKQIKGVVRLSFTSEQPLGFWEEVQGREYGFYANVNPKVSHPRWSQATERDVASGNRRPTELFNGYGGYVAHLYQGMEAELGDRLWR